MPQRQITDNMQSIQLFIPPRDDYQNRKDTTKYITKPTLSRLTPQPLGAEKKQTTVTPESLAIPDSSSTSHGEGA